MKYGGFKSEEGLQDGEVWREWSVVAPWVHGGEGYGVIRGNGVSQCHGVRGDVGE
jgi:hypothetical protein